VDPVTMIAGGSGPEIEAGTVDDRERLYHRELYLQLDFCKRGPTLGRQIAGLFKISASSP